jgi:predicted nucleotidyltransferase
MKIVMITVPRQMKLYTWASRNHKLYSSAEQIERVLNKYIQALKSLLNNKDWII